MTRSILCTLLIIIISCGNALARQTAATGNPKETAAPAAAIAPAAAGTISTEEETPATGNAPASEAAIPASEAAVPADGQKQLQALKAAEVQSPIRGKKQFLPTRRRIDREINKLKFAYKGEVIMGLTAQERSVTETAKECGCSVSTVKRCKRMKLKQQSLWDVFGHDVL